MYHSALRLAQSHGGEARIMFENAAQGQQLSWNTDVDYGMFLETANPALQRAAETLCNKAGGDLAGDLERLAKTPRNSASSHALDFWTAPERNTIGQPKIPVMRLHMVGDYQIPFTLMLGYIDAVRANGCGELVRTALLRSTGQCNSPPPQAPSRLRQCWRGWKREIGLTPALRLSTRRQRRLMRAIAHVSWKWTGMKCHGLTEVGCQISSQNHHCGRNNDPELWPETNRRNSRSNVKLRL